MSNVVEPPTMRESETDCGVLPRMLVDSISAVKPGVSGVTMMRESWTAPCASRTTPTPGLLFSKSRYCSVDQYVARLPSVMFGAALGCSLLSGPEGSDEAIPLIEIGLPTATLCL